MIIQQIGEPANKFSFVFTSTIYLNYARKIIIENKTEQIQKKNKKNISATINSFCKQIKKNLILSMELIDRETDMLEMLV